MPAPAKAAKAANPAAEPTPQTATVIGRRREGEEVQFPRRTVHCPGCGAAWVVEPAEGAEALPVLHLDFACADCNYSTALGLG